MRKRFHLDLVFSAIFLLSLFQGAGPGLLQAAEKGRLPPRPTPPPEVRKSAEPARPEPKLGPEKSMGDPRPAKLSMDPRQTNGPRGDPSKMARAMEKGSSFSGSGRTAVEARLKEKAEKTTTDRARFDSFKSADAPRGGQEAARGQDAKKSAGPEIRKGTGAEFRKGVSSEGPRLTDRSSGNDRMKESVNGGKAERTEKRESTGSESKKFDNRGNNGRETEVGKSDAKAKGSDTIARIEARNIEKKNADRSTEKKTAEVKHETQNRGADKKTAEQNRNAETHKNEVRSESSRSQSDAIARIESRNRPKAERRDKDALAKIEARTKERTLSDSTGISSKKAGRQSEVRTGREFTTAEKKSGKSIEARFLSERGARERVAEVDILRSERGSKEAYTEKKDTGHGHLAVHSEQGGKAVKGSASSVHSNFGPKRPITGNKPTHPPDSAFTEKALAITPGEIRAEIDRMKSEGHAVGRHGADITDGQTTLRVQEKIDPLTQTREDGDRAGKLHNAASRATQFTSERALVSARRAVETSEAYQAELADAIAQGKLQFTVKTLNLETALGPQYLQHVRGDMLVGEPGPNAPVKPLNLTNGHLVAVYTREKGGNGYKLKTLYPEIPNVR